jgi:hypothetical protein
MSILFILSSLIKRWIENKFNQIDVIPKHIHTARFRVLVMSLGISIVMPIDLFKSHR